jgi:hypothetical protein
MSDSPNTKRGTGSQRSNDDWIVELTVELIWAMLKAAGYLLWLAILFPAISVPAFISLTMMLRQQLPPQIKKITLKNGKVRYHVKENGRVDPITKQRPKLDKRFDTAQEARDALRDFQYQTARGTYVMRSTLTVEQACANCGRPTRSAQVGQGRLPQWSATSA